GRSASSAIRRKLSVPRSTRPRVTSPESRPAWSQAYRLRTTSSEAKRACLSFLLSGSHLVSPKQPSLGQPPALNTSYANCSETREWQRLAVVLAVDQPPLAVGV